ncbi:ABC-type branched-subunit amino acid transport system substrate-binding protein [Bradyrhizobium sp. S3.14.4]
MTRSRSAACVALAVALLAAANPAAKGDEVGVSDDAILFGQAAALEGPSSALGQRMRQGIVAAFTEINENGAASTAAGSSSSAATTATIPTARWRRRCG